MKLLIYLFFFFEHFRPQFPFYSKRVLYLGALEKILCVRRAYILYSTFQFPLSLKSFKDSDL